jgi:RimJ/RimL family protein N-acetyltransferase
MWAVMADGGMVGTLGADVEGTTADLGIMIGRPGKGYGRAAWGRGIQALLLESPGRRITAGTHIDNAAMIAIFAAYHMRLLAIRDGHVYVAL